MPTPVIDPTLREEVLHILHTSGVTARADQPLRIASVDNSFQDKGNVFTVGLVDGPTFILKLEHTHFESHLQREAFLLDFFATTEVPVPRLIAHGTCAVYRRESLAPYFILMEHLRGVPLNWRYYRAEREERRTYLRQIVALIGALSTFRVRQPEGAVTLGSIAAPLRRVGTFVACDHLMAFPNEPVGPFASVSAMMEAQIGFWLAQLEAQPDDHYSTTLHTVWARLDRSVLAGDVPIAVAHADIAPMNMMVDPDAQRITGLIDWEFAGFYPADMDFHSLLYYDRFQSWKLTGAEDVLMARGLMREQGIEPPAGYDERLPWFDLLQLAKDAAHYRGWFTNAPDEHARYAQALERRIDHLVRTT